MADWMASTGVMSAIKTALARFCGDQGRPHALLFAGAARATAALFTSATLANGEEGVQLLRKVRECHCTVALRCGAGGD